MQSETNRQRWIRQVTYTQRRVFPARSSFVVSRLYDVEEVREVVRANALPRGRVFLMAEGTDGATLRARQEWLVPLCLEHGLRLSDRLHIHLFGDTRGT